MHDHRARGPDRDHKREKKTKRIAPEERGLGDVIGNLEKCPGGPLGSLCGSEVESHQASQDYEDPKGRLFESSRAAIAPKRFDTEASQDKQADDRHVREDVIDVINSADERQTNDQGRWDDAEHNRQGKETGYGWPPTA